MAIHSYHAAYGSLPPAYVADSSGRPAHSWRVLLLPFLQQEALYERYRFDEPWDGPNNIKLVDSMPSVFRCSADSEEQSRCTNYVAIIGPHTAWPGEAPASFSDVTDGASNTWLIVELADSGINWTEPRDLHVLQMAPQINPPAGQGISSKHPGGANVACVDGSVWSVPELLAPQEVRAMITIDGGEKISQDW